MYFCLPLPMYFSLPFTPFQVAYTNYLTDPRIRREADALAKGGDMLEFFCLSSQLQKVRTFPIIFITKKLTSLILKPILFYDEIF